MKRYITLTIATLICSLFIYCQEQTISVTIQLKDGHTLDVKHFGQLNCSNSQYFDSRILLKGKYEGTHTLIDDYSKISKMVLIGFKKDPAASVGNEKGEITVYRKNGNTINLTDAELSLACYGSIEKYNQIRVQMINPLTDERFEKVIDTKDIESISFK